MSNIYIYAEQFDNVVEPSAAELVTLVREFSKKSGQKITLLAFGEDTSAIAFQLAFDDVSVTVVKTPVSAFQDDAISVVVADALEKLKPDSVIIPASRTARALFSRVAVRLGVGLTADCSELDVDEHGEFIQRKSAFGANAMCVCVEKGGPKLVTVLVGGIHESAPLSGTVPAVTELEGLEAASRVEVLDIEEDNAESILGAETIVSVGRGALENDNLALAEQFAQKIGAMVGGTRPLVDDGSIPFDRQIGQTGCTVHPKVCLYFGVSGAIQHTEGVRDAKLTIAVNKDPEAAIFGHADYGVVADMGELLKQLLLLY